MLFVSQHGFTHQQKPLLLGQTDILLRCKGQASSFGAWTADQNHQSKLQDLHVTLVLASEVLYSSTLKNGS